MSGLLPTLHISVINSAFNFLHSTVDAHEQISFSTFNAKLSTNINNGISCHSSISFMKAFDKRRVRGDLFSQPAPKVYFKQQFRFSEDTKPLMNAIHFLVGNCKGQFKIYNELLQVSEGSQAQVSRRLQTIKDSHSRFLKSNEDKVFCKTCHQSFRVRRMIMRLFFFNHRNPSEKYNRRLCPRLLNDMLLLLHTSSLTHGQRPQS